MGLLSRFEGKMEDTVEGAADRMGAAPLSPVDRKSTRLNSSHS